MVSNALTVGPQLRGCGLDSADETPPPDDLARVETSDQSRPILYEH